MDIKHNFSKTLGVNEAHFILALYEKNKPIFTLLDALKLTGLDGKKLQKFLTLLIQKGILVRLISGLYSIVPFELGYTKEFMGNPYVIAREIVMQKMKDNVFYYISHASALELHQMVTQPQLVIFVTVLRQIKQKVCIMGTEFRFIMCKKENFFGFKKFWIDKSEMILISDVERTIIDCVKVPEYCGGMTEIAKGLWMKKNEIDFEKLVEYAEKIDKGMIYRRLGFILELYGLSNERLLNRLQMKLTNYYLLLDPLLPDEGKYNSRWRLRLNVLEEEFLSVVRS